jgi:hypothetical protein
MTGAVHLIWIKDGHTNLPAIAALCAEMAGHETDWRIDIIRLMRGSLSDGRDRLRDCAR